MDRQRSQQVRRVAVVGVGAIGGAVAADLAGLARHDLLLCSRTPFERLIVRRQDAVVEVAIAATTNPARVTKVDWVLLATKAHQSAAARPWLDALCGPATVVAVLQNGIDHVERVRPLVDAGVRVLPRSRWPRCFAARRITGPPSRSIGERDARWSGRCATR